MSIEHEHGDVGKGSIPFLHRHEKIFNVHLAGVFFGKTLGPTYCPLLKKIRFSLDLLQNPW